MTIYLDRFLELELIDKKKYDNFKKNIDDQIKALENAQNEGTNE